MTLELNVQDVADWPNVPDEQQFRHWAVAAGAEGELTIRIVAPPESQQLNSDYRDKDQATNVLSFPFDAPAEVNTDYMGDLLVCAAVVSQEAAEQGKPLESHWAHMIVHGVLHLRGYDHLSETEADEMETLEIQIMAQLGYDNPYHTNYS